MKTKITLILVSIGILCSLQLLSQTTTQNRNTGTFDGISTSSGIDVIYTIGNSHSVKVEAEASIINNIETTVENGVLVIKRKKGTSLQTRHNLVVYVTAPSLKTVSASGGADFSAEQLISKDDIQLSASGGADLNISKLTANKVSINVSGGSDAEIKDLTADSCNLNASGGADAKIKLTSTNLLANASGGADIELKGKTENLKINCSGGADADIKGLTYDKIESNASGGGDIKK